MLVHDTLKFKEEEQKRRDKLAREKEELKRYLFVQMRHREEEHEIGRYLRQEYRVLRHRRGQDALHGAVLGLDLERPADAE